MIHDLKLKKSVKCKNFGRNSDTLKLNCNQQPTGTVTMSNIQVSGVVLRIEAVSACSFGFFRL